MSTTFENPNPLPEKPSYVPTEEERTWGLIAHLSFLAGGLVGLPFVGPLVVWLIKKDQSPFVADQAKEALNFHLSVLIATLVCVVVPCIGWVALIGVAIGAIVYSIMAAMEANKGQYYRYPYTIRMIS